MATSRPAGLTVGDTVLVFLSTEHSATNNKLTITLYWGLRHVALNAQVIVTSDQHLGVYGAVRVMASGATFADGLVLKDVGTFLGYVTFGAGRHFAFESRGAFALDSITFMWVMAIAAGDLARHHRVAVGKTELAALVDMTGKAGIGVLLGIYNRALAAAGFNVSTCSTVAGFATDSRAFNAISIELSMSGALKLGSDFAMASGAFLGANNFGTRHLS
jgi:hypothetical protein